MIFCSVIPNAAGRRTSVTLPKDVLVEYAYDDASRLTEITYKQDGTTHLGNLTYEYDKNGNRIKTGGSFTRTGLPQAVTSTVYNAANHQTTVGDKTLTYDNNGNLQTITDSGGTTTYTWNARNQLTGMSGPGGFAGYGQGVAARGGSFSRGSTVAVTAGAGFGLGSSSVVGGLCRTWVLACS